MEGALGSSYVGSTMTNSVSRRQALTVLTAAGLALASGAALAQPAPKAPPAPVLNAADKALVDKAVAYLQGLNSAKGRFVQTDARGAVARGSLYLQRPGKARFAYDPPSGLIIVSNGSTVSVADTRLKTFQSYPLGASPLSLFLAREIRLDRGVVIDRVERLAGGYSISARDGRRQAEGRIKLIFSNAPVLTGWEITDAQGQITRVAVTELAPASGLDPALFVLRDPRPRPGGGRP